MFDDVTLKESVAISNPRMWFFCLGTYLLGVGMGGYLFKEALLTVSVWQFIVLSLWAISAGMFMGISRNAKPNIYIFPWEFIRYIFIYICNGGKIKIGEFQKQRRISFLMNGIFLILSISIVIIRPSSIIMILSMCLLGIDFLYNSSYIRAIYKDYFNAVAGIALLTPFFMGYTFITNTFPNGHLNIAGISYALAIGIYSNAVEGEYVFLSKNTALVVSGILSIVCASILVRYGTIYFATTSSLLMVLGMSLFAKDSSEMHMIHIKAFYLHLIVGVIVGTYFFTH
jgi:hypothetical protein